MQGAFNINQSWTGSPSQQAESEELWQPWTLKPKRPIINVVIGKTFVATCYQPTKFIDCQTCIDLYIENLFDTDFFPHPLADTWQYSGFTQA